MTVWSSKNSSQYIITVNEKHPVALRNMKCYSTDRCDLESTLICKTVIYHTYIIFFIYSFDMARMLEKYLRDEGHEGRRMKAGLGVSPSIGTN